MTSAVVGSLNPPGMGLREERESERRMVAGGVLWEEASVRVRSGREESMRTAAVEERRLLLLTRWRFFGAAPAWFAITIVFQRGRGFGLDQRKIGSEEIII